MTFQQTFDFLETSPEVSETGSRTTKVSSSKAKSSLKPRMPLISASVSASSVSMGIEDIERGPAVESEPALGAEEADRFKTPAVDTVVGSQASVVDRAAMLDQLRAQVGCIQTAAGEKSCETFSTGSDAIDRLLPRGGLRFDGVTEWVAQSEGSGAATLAMIAAASAMQSPCQRSASRGPLVVVSSNHHRQGDFFPPAAVSLGISVDRIIWVRSDRHADLVWAIDQALRCESVAAVWAHVGANLDDRDARRFQLASEEGRTPGLLIRPVSTRGCPSFADVRWHVGNHETTAPVHDRQPTDSSLGRVMNVTLDRCRGGTVGRNVWVQIDDQAHIHSIASPQLGTSNNETAALRLASELAHPKSSNRKATRRRA